jgi:ribosomal biogenesis protein LAS1
MNSSRTHAYIPLQALTWLLHNYFLPTLNPAPSSARAPPPSVRPVEPLLRQYKSVLKTVARDASLRARRAPDIAGVLREIERWLAEARVAAMQMHAGEFASGLLSYRGRQSGEAAAAAVDNGDGYGGGDEEELEPREAWALDKLCDALLVKGALVPISRKSVINISPLPYPLSLSLDVRQK